MTNGHARRERKNIETCSTTDNADNAINSGNHTALLVVVLVDLVTKRGLNFLENVNLILS